MVKTIYVDILFLINFIINYLILFCSAHMSGARIRRLRILLGAFFGAAYGVAVFFRELSFLGSFIFKIIMAFVMTACAFGFFDIRKLFRMTLVFYLISFAFGGIVFALYLLGAGGLCEVRNDIYYIHVPLKVLLISAGAAYLLLSIVFYRSTSEKKRRFCNITVEHEGRKSEFTALYDPGNTLTDPLTNAPVVICDYSAVREALPESVRSVLDRKSPSGFPLSADELPPELKFRLIPYKTMNSPFSVLLAFRPDKVTVDGKYDDKTLLALSPEKISDGGAYAALI